MTGDPSAPSAGEPRLKRSLKLRDLVLFGIIVIQPVAPMSVFGVLSQEGRGHVVTAVLLAMVAMLITGISYGRMARVYPSAGSAFVYVSREIHPAVGWLTGWSMLMDYVLNPLICTIWCAQQALVLVPGVPVWLWKAGFATAFTGLNLRGIQSSARANAIMTAGMGVVVLMVVGAALHYLGHHLSADRSAFTRPFYDPSTFTLGALLRTTSIAVLTYIGFDGISTLSEEVENPRRNILIATVLTCVVVGILAAVEVYLAQLVWPANEPFPNVDAAYVLVAARTWAPLLPILGLTLLIANFGSGLAAQLGAGRLLYGMGRSGALPPRIFGALDRKTQVPRNNVIMIGAVVFVGSYLMTYGLGAEMLNFGALFAFMGVNLAAFLRYFVRAAERKLWNAVMPLTGFFICFGLWFGLGRPAKLAGAAWMALGLGVGLWRKRGFRSKWTFAE